MESILIKNATIVNENSRVSGDVLVRGEMIERVDQNIEVDHKCKELRLG